MCALETRQPYLKYQKGICSHTLQWMISTSTFNLLVLFSLENRYLQALLLLNLLGMNYRSVGLMKAQKSLEHLTRTNVFIAVYYRTPLLQRMIQTLSWVNTHNSLSFFLAHLSSNSNFTHSSLMTSTRSTVYFYATSPFLFS